MRTVNFVKCNTPTILTCVGAAGVITTWTNCRLFGVLRRDYNRAVNERRIEYV